MWLTRGGVKTRDFLIRLEATCHKHHTEQEARAREKQKPKINREREEGESFIAWWEWGDQTRKGDGDPIRSHLLAAHRSPSPLLPPPPLVVLVAVSSSIYLGVFFFHLSICIYLYPPPPRFFFFFLLLPRVAAAGVSARVPRVSFRPSQLALRAAAAAAAIPDRATPAIAR